jgi:hypothetical protein
MRTVPDDGQTWQQIPSFSAEQQVNLYPGKHPEQKLLAIQDNVLYCTKFSLSARQTTEASSFLSALTSLSFIDH